MTYIYKWCLNLELYTLCTVVLVKSVHQDGFRLQSPESMALEHSLSKCIPEDHYGNVTWNNFNLATELPRIPRIPLLPSLNNPHRLTEFQNIKWLRPCHHLHEAKTSDQTLKPEYGRHNSRRSSRQRKPRQLYNASWTFLILLYTCRTTINHSLCMDESLL